MDALAAAQPGYRGVDSARGADGSGITISYWADEASALRVARPSRAHARSATPGAGAGMRATRSSWRESTRDYRWERREDARRDRPRFRAAVHGDADDRGGQYRAAIGAARARPLAAASPDSAVAAAFSVSALLWVIAAPFWANRSDRHGRRAMILLGLGGFTMSLLLCGAVPRRRDQRLDRRDRRPSLLFIAGRLIYGAFGSAAPPAVQALVAGRDHAARSGPRR